MNLNKRISTWMVAPALLLTLGALVCDLFLPIGMGVALPYLLAIMFTLYVPNRKMMIAIGVVISAFLLLGYFATASQENSLQQLGGRLVIMAAIWLAIFMIIRYKFSEEMTISNLLTKHQEKIDALFEYATEGMIITNAKGEIVLLNPKAEEQFGYEKGELIGQHIEVLVPPKYKVRHQGHRSKFYKDPHSRPMGQGRDLHARHKSGSEFPVEISLSNFETEEGLFVIAFVIDITERKKQENMIRLANEELQQSLMEINTLNTQLEQRVEARTRELEQNNILLIEQIREKEEAEMALIDNQQLLSTIAKNFPNGIIQVLDEDFRYVFVDGKEMHHLQLTSEKLIGKPLSTIIPALKINGIEQQLQKVLRGESISFEVEMHAMTYLFHAVPLTDARGAISQVLLVSQNITELKKAEEDVRKALAREKELNELKSVFVSTASHEFRTPLSTILSSASLISKYNKPGDDEKRLKHIERIKLSVANLIGILNDFLSISRIEEGKVQLQPSEFSVVDFCEELKEEMQPAAKEGQQIILSCEADMPTILLDRHVLKNVLLNLLSNAIKYSPEHKPIYLKAQVAGQEITFVVQDKGYGIPAQDQKFIFDTFFRANNVTGIQGTGLGLNIVKKYIEIMEGTITFASKEAEGTTFTVKLRQFEPGPVKVGQEVNLL